MDNKKTPIKLKNFSALQKIMTFRKFCLIRKFSGINFFRYDFQDSPQCFV